MGGRGGGGVMNNNKLYMFNENFVETGYDFKHFVCDTIFAPLRLNKTLN